MVDTKEIARATQRCFDAYESGDLEQTLAIYTDDVVYWDAKSSGMVRGKPAMRPYLAAFLARYDTRFAVLEQHRLEGQDGAVVLWECAIRRRQASGRPGEALVLQRGMDIFMVRDDKISRRESYIDLPVVDSLLNEAEKGAH